jgi:hypothetical protein
LFASQKDDVPKMSQAILKIRPPSDFSHKAPFPGTLKSRQHPIPGGTVAAVLFFRFFSRPFVVFVRQSSLRFHAAVTLPPHIEIWGNR